MIVRPLGGSLRLVTQPDHAAFAADALALLRLPELVDHPRRAALLRAVRFHDDGWRELDAAPPVDRARGRPWDFRDLPHDQRLAVWERGTARSLADDPFVALLVHQHALTLHAGYEDEPGWAELLSRLRERRAELLAASGASEEELAAAYSLLDLADGLSLAVCAGWLEPFTRRGIRAALSGDDLLLWPFPLAGATTLTVSCRQVPDRRYAGDADLAAELGAARWQDVRVRLVPGPPAPG